MNSETMTQDELNVFDLIYENLNRPFESLPRWFRVTFNFVACSGAYDDPQVRAQAKSAVQAEISNFLDQFNAAARDAGCLRPGDVTSAIPWIRPWVETHRRTKVRRLRFDVHLMLEIPGRPTDDELREWFPEHLFITERPCWSDAIEQIGSDINILNWGKYLFREGDIRRSDLDWENLSC